MRFEVWVLGKKGDTLMEGGIKIYMFTHLGLNSFHYKFTSFEIFNLVNYFI